MTRRVTHAHRGAQKEAQIFALWDAGHTIEHIADQLALRRERVRDVLSVQCSINKDDRWPTAARKATDQLAVRILEMLERRAA